MSINGTDWTSLRMQYEVFGETPESIAEQYGVSRTMVVYAAEEQGWQRLPIADTVHDWKDINNLDVIDDALLDDVKKKMKILSVLKQNALTPKIILAKATLIGKTLDVIKNIKPEYPHAPTQLKACTEVLTALSVDMDIDATGDKNTQGGAAGLTVQIVGQFGGGEGTPKAAIGTEIHIAGSSVQDAIEIPENT